MSIVINGIEWYQPILIMVGGTICFCMGVLVVRGEFNE